MRGSLARRVLLGLVVVLGLGISAGHLRTLAEDRSLWGDAGPLHPGWVWGALAAVALQVGGHLLRARNAQRLLQVIRPTRRAPHLKGLALGYLFNALMPFRLGELVRAHVVGRAMSISRGVVFFTILFERAVDGLVLSAAAMGVSLLLARERPELLGVMGGLAGAVALVSALAAGLIYVLYSQPRALLRAAHGTTALFNDAIRDRLRFVLWSVGYGLHVIFRSARLGRYVVTSVAMWTLYLGSVAALVQGVAPARAALEKLAASAGAYLSVSVPSGPAFLGTFHVYFSRFARVTLGLEGTPIVLSMVTWAVLMAPFALVGAGFLVARRRRPAVASPAHDSNAGRALEPLKHKLHRDSDVSAELSHFLDEYFSGQQLSRVLSRGEMSGEFRVVKTFKGGSNASTLLVWESDSLCVKKVTLSQHADKLRAQREWLLAHGHLPQIPKVTGESEGQEHYAFNLEFRQSFVPFFEYLHSESVERAAAVLEGVLDFMYGEVYRLGKPGRSPAQLEQYLADKVLQKVADAAALSPTLEELLTHERLAINGRECLNLHGCVAKLRALPRALEDLETFSQGPIHGDLTVDNLIVSRESGEFLVLDPNNENAISDPVVDMGKLYQSLHSGYEFLCQLPEAKVDGATVRFEDSVSSRYAELFRRLEEMLERRLSPSARRAVLFHEAVHYCRMLTYRARINEASLPAFFATAVKRFNDFLQQYEDEVKHVSTDTVAA